MWKVGVLFLTTWLFILPSASAQRNQAIRVDRYEDLTKVLSYSERYLYPDFREGQILYGTGKLSGGHLFNYDILKGDIAMIGEKNDTLLVISEKAFHYVSIGKDVFYHDSNKGYFELVAEVDSVRLAVKDLFIVSGAGYRSPYYWLYRGQSLFLIDREDQIYKATRGRLLQLLPRRKKEIKMLMHKNKSDFRKKEDIAQLFEQLGNGTRAADAR